SQMVKAQRDMLNITDTDELIRLSKISTRTVNSAKTFVAMIPILMVYPALQRYFVTGIVMGSIKE
ncbi:MAG: carbohydrate ABC transporter permease, partial [Clostridiales bacterium]|nr:carbohydrate ABC transporter permease [Clostridiales bacterium]